MALTNAAVAPDDGLVIDKQNMPCTQDRGLGERVRIGLIVLSIDQTLEHEFRKVLDVPGVAFYETRIHVDPLINEATLAAMEHDIPGCVSLIMPGLPLDVVAFACTSGAMVIGDDVVRRRIHEVRPGVPTTTPMAAALAAFQAVGARRICLIAPYVDAVNRRMRRYIMDQGHAVPVMASWNLEEDDKVARISPASIRDAVLDVGRSDAADMVFVSCSSLRVAELVEELEAAIGKPVTSSNHALAWHCLRLGGYDAPVEGFGQLFRTPLAR